MDAAANNVNPNLATGLKWGNHLLCHPPIRAWRMQHVSESLLLAACTEVAMPASIASFTLDDKVTLGKRARH